MIIQSELYWEAGTVYHTFFLPYSQTVLRSQFLPLNILTYIILWQNILISFTVYCTSRLEFWCQKDCRTHSDGQWTILHIHVLMCNKPPYNIVQKSLKLHYTSRSYILQSENHIITFKIDYVQQGIDLEFSESI